MKTAKPQNATHPLPHSFRWVPILVLSFWNGQVYPSMDSLFICILRRRSIGLDRASAFGRYR